MTLIFILFLKSLTQYSGFVLLIWCFCPGTLIILLLYFRPNSFSRICLRVYCSGSFLQVYNGPLQYVHLGLFWKFFWVTVLNTTSVSLFCFSSSETAYLHAGPSFLTFCFFQYLTTFISLYDLIFLVFFFFLQCPLLNFLLSLLSLNHFAIYYFQSWLIFFLNIFPEITTLWLCSSHEEFFWLLFLCQLFSLLKFLILDLKKNFTFLLEYLNFQLKCVVIFSCLCVLFFIFWG